jgi:hypothetical protein
MAHHGVGQGAAFDPEAIRAMSLALEGACADLGLKMRDDPATRLVAKQVIELAQQGILEAKKLRALTLAEFRARRPS